MMLDKRKKIGFEKHLKGAKMKFFVFKKKAFFAFVAILIILIIVISVVLTSDALGAFAFKKDRKLPIYCVKTDEVKVALTFDAAWGADKTEQIMEVLKRYDAGATFFLVEFWVKEYPEMVKKISENGFEIGTHSSTHPKMSTLSREKVDSELKTSKKAIEDLTGKKVQVFRPPFGDYNNALIEIAQENELFTIQWDVDSLDWKGLGSKEILQRVEKRAKNGSIILFHNNSDNIVDGLTLVCDMLKNRGFKFVAVSDLIYKEDYTIIQDGTQVKNK